MYRIVILVCALGAVGCDEHGELVGQDGADLARATSAAGAGTATRAGGSTKQVGPFCNEACPDDQGLQDACEDDDPDVTCIPSTNDTHGSECWIEEYDSRTCPSGYVVQCSCWSTATPSGF